MEKKIKLNDYSLSLNTGAMIPVPELSLTVYQPTIYEIGLMGEKNFFIGAQFLCLSKTAYLKDKTLLDNITNFQVIMTVLEEDKTGETKNSIQLLLDLIFPNYSCMMTPQSIILKEKEGENIVILDSNNFETIQPIFNDIFCMNNSMLGGHTNFNPKGKKAQEIADKLMRGRQRVQAQREGKGPKGSTLGRYLSVLSVGSNKSRMELNKYTLFQLLDELQRFNLYSSWQADFKVRLAGGKVEGQPEDWTKDLYSN